MFQRAIKTILATSSLVFATSCSSENTEAKDKELTFYQSVAMTVPYTIMVDDVNSMEEDEAVYAIISGVFEEINRVYNRWNPKSELSQLNLAPAGIPVPVSPKLYQFLEWTHDIVDLTEQRFDPTVEPLKQLWKEYGEQGLRPPEDELIAMKDVVGWDKIRLLSGHVVKEHENTRLDLDGICKGYAVDLIVERLVANGHPNVFVDWGGEIRSAGQHPSGRPWKIFITRLGDTNPENAIATVQLHNTAIATSGDYHQTWVVPSEENDSLEKVCHIIDPETLDPLSPSEESITSASIQAPNCLTADAIATAAMMFSDLREAAAWMQRVQSRRPDLKIWLITHGGQSYSTEGSL